VSGALTVEPAGGFDELREDWQRLADAAGSPFSTWEWATTWWEHYGDGRPLHLLRCRAPDGRMAAILPLFLARRTPVRMLRFVGQGPADQLAPVCAPEDAPAAAEALVRAVREGTAGARVLMAAGWSGSGAAC
jgi:CelD/BcsL family acetyltransferase involved in cellulose biosynthesis